jgi:hypothetical protein
MPIDRREFMKWCAATGSAAAIGLPTASDADDLLGMFFPQLPPPKRLQGVRLTKDHSWEEWTLLTCLQGLVNRVEPRIFFLNDDYDALWLSYYAETYGIATDSATTDAVLEQHAGEISGYIVYDDAMLDSLNVATTWGALENALPAPASLVPRLRDHGLREIEDLRGRWTDRYAAYEWALETLHPRCHPRIVGAVCVDRPHWPSTSTWVRDYIMAHRVFVCDLSASRRDRRDRALLARIFEQMESPGWSLGWRCVRCTEHEYVGLAAQHGINMQCGLSTLNLTVHSAIPRVMTPYTQDHATPESVGPVEDKVYVSFMNTDGDATFSMTRLHSKRMRDAEHGRIPYSFGFLPAACDLMPGVARYLYEHKHENDYYVASTCGAMYTYPAMHPDMRSYLAMTRSYMRRAGLRVAYMSNWDDDFWWQEIDLPGFVPALRAALPEAIGFVRGMGESAWEPHYLGAQPYVYCGEGIHKDGDIYETLRTYAEALPQRPLFLFCLVNHNRTQGEMFAAATRLGNEAYRFVKLDSFLQLTRKAHQEGLVGDDLDPPTPALREMLAREGREAWPGVVTRVRDHAQRAGGRQSAFRKYNHDDVTRTILADSATTPADIVAFDVIWDSLHLTKAALNARGIYVNEKARGVVDFMHEFGALAHAAIVPELWKAWVAWEKRAPKYKEARGWCEELARLADEMDPLLKA